MKGLVLIVDDHPVNLKLASEVLLAGDFRVVAAADAEQAQQLLATLVPDLILMDIALPGMDGLSLTKIIKRDARLCHVPVAALTAYAMRGDELKASDAGCDAYITKPIDTRRLVEQVAALINAARVRPPAKALTFLIADDVPGNLKLLRAGLESEGHQVIEAANGVEALAVLDLENIDAVISDILMPSMDGFRLCSEIRGSTKSYREVPIILYTGTYDSLADRALADSVGADAYMLKPAPAAALIAAVQDARRDSARRAKAPSVAAEADVLKHYNAALVHKLEARSSEAQNTLAELQSAHRQIVEINRSLETRVAQRTAALDTANQELEAFAFSVSHDLQAPLRRISGFAQLLKDSVSPSIDGNNREMLGHVIDASAQMSQLIDALLAFARTSRTEMHFAEVDLDVLADKVIADLHVGGGRIIEWRRTPLPSVRGDAILLHQVLVNLLSNAVKYTRTRDKAVIEIGASDGHNNETVISISDNGVGFDMRYAGKLFGVFERMHRADDFEGTGIGLANAQRIVTRHGGSIWANASPGSGATFCVSLPRS